ncbi:MAG: acyltransferase, partial [Variovorax sp.]
MTPTQRFPGVDALKGVACVTIVWHHLAFYGPMSDVVHGAVPWLMDWLYRYGRMAVQVF